LQANLLITAPAGDYTTDTDMSMKQNPEFTV